MKVRFQADADLNQTIVSAIIRRMIDIDFRTASAAGLAGLNDREVLALAARDGRILVTHDQSTMPQHFATFVSEQQSPGVLIVPRHHSMKQIVDDLILIWSATEAEEWTNRIVYLPL